MTKSQAIFDRMLREAIQARVVPTNTTCRLCKCPIQYHVVLDRPYCDDCREALR